nr:hypothetical protein [Tanacetum cinerariifolium]
QNSDLYNNLRVFECDVKGTTASSTSNTQNVAFVSADNTSSTNDVSTAYSVSSPSVSKSHKGILLETVELKGIKTVKEEMLDTMETKLETVSGHVEEDTQNYAMMAYSSSNSGSDNETSADESDSKRVKYASSESDSSVEPTTSMPAPVETQPKVVCEPKVWNDAPII